MSLDYRSKTGWYFNANSAGTELLGLVHKLAGATLSRGPDALGPRPPFVARGRECCANAARIAAVTDEQIAALLDDDDVRKMHGGSHGEFVAWVRDWQAFLSHCDGYDTDPKWRLAPDVAFLEWTWERLGKCGSCKHFDPCFITELGSGHCGLFDDRRVHEHQHCVLNPAKYAARVVVAPAPLGKGR
jgi:hypothetical protein